MKISDLNPEYDKLQKIRQMIKSFVFYYKTLLTRCQKSDI